MAPSGAGHQPDDPRLDAGSINHFGLAARDATTLLLLIARNHAAEVVYEGPHRYSIHAVDPDGPSSR